METILALLGLLGVILLAFLLAALHIGFYIGMVYLLYLGYTVSGWYAVLAVVILGIIYLIKLD